jgi:HEAT repeat protein
MSFPRTGRAAVLGCVLALAAVLPAHGGQYRGPAMPAVPMPPGGGGGGGPTTGGGGPSAPAPPAPTTGAGPSIPDEASWQIWWELNKDEYVQQDTTGRVGPTTGSDDFYLGQRRERAAVDTLAPTAMDCAERIVPALVALMERERNRDVQTACLIALAKIGRDGAGIAIDDVIAARLSRDDQEVRETAVLALGIAGRPNALARLCAILRNDADGKRLTDRTDVGDRTRAFAAYGLGVLAQRSNDAALKQAAHDALIAVLRDKELKSRDLRAAAVNALGILCDPRQAAHKRLAWVTVEELLAWYQEDLGRADEAIQAQAPVAIGRLLGRGSSQLHERCKRHFADVLLASNKRSNPILQSAAIALGMLALPAEQHAPDAAIAKTLQVYWEKGVDRLARFFAVMAMARIGGDANRAWLLGTYARANKTVERPWLVLALGVLAADRAAAGEIDAAFAQLVLDDIADAQKPDVQAAMAVALGLSRYEPALPRMLALLRDAEHQETLAGYFCIGSALLGDRAAVKPLAAILERSKRRPFLLQQAAVGLGRLGDRNANDQLLAMIAGSESVAVLAALANAIGQIGDRRAIEPLVALTRDGELTKLARAFVAAALGGVGDRYPLPWNMPLSRDSNYGAPVDTLSNGATGVLDIL